MQVHQIWSPSQASRPIGWCWSPFPKALSQTPVFTLRDHGYGASASCGVPVYVPVFTGTHCAYPEGWPGWVDPGTLLHTRMVYPPSNSHPSKYKPGPASINFIDATSDITDKAKPQDHYLKHAHMGGLKQLFNTYGRRVCISGRRQTSHALPLVSDINWKLWSNSLDCGLRSMMKSSSEASVNLYRGCPCRNLDSSVNWLGVDVACVNSRHQFTLWDHVFGTSTGNDTPALNQQWKLAMEKLGYQRGLTRHWYSLC